MKKTIQHNQVGFTSEMHKWLNLCKSINVIHHEYTERQNYMIISLDGEMGFEKNPTHLHDKSPRETKDTTDICQHNKGNTKTHSQHHPKQRKTQSIPTNQKKTKILNLYLFNVGHDILARAIIQQKEIKGMHQERKKSKYLYLKIM